MRLKKERSENVSTCSINLLFSVTLKSFMANGRTVWAKMHEARNERTKQLNGNCLGSCNRPIVMQRKTGLVERLGSNVFAHISRPHVRGESPLVAEKKIQCTLFNLTQQLATIPDTTSLT